MLKSVIRYFFTMICSVYCYRKLLNIKKYTLVEICIVPFSIITAFFIAFININIPFLTVIFLAFFTNIIYYFVYKKELILSLITTTLSVSISHFLFGISIFILIPITSILYIKISNKFILSILTIVLVGICQNFIMYLIFKIKRFKHGIPDIKYKSDTAIYLSVLLLLSASFSYQYKDMLTITTAIFFLAILFGLTIFLWWRKRLSDKYINKVYERNIRILEDTLSTQKTEIENLSKIIHKDNKVLSALRLAVNEQYSNNGENSAELQNLLNEITHLEDERKECLTNYEQTTKILAKTGVFSTDMIINYLLKRANKESIIFDVSITGDILYMVSDAIDTYDLNTMLADLGENAIIATSHSAVKNVLLIIGYRENTAFFDIYDSGSEFDAGVIANIGKRRHTTHKDTGGSGIGLMTTYELINKYHATFEIEELYNNKLFTKRVSVLFDNNSRIAIYSNRPEIIAACKSRSDIQLIPIP